MADIINFSLERAKRKSGMKDTSVLQDMIDQGYDPCSPADIQDYQQWNTFQSIIYDDIDVSHNWSEEALDRLFEDIKNFDPNEMVTYTVDMDLDEIKDLVVSTEDDLDFTNYLPTK